MDSEIVINNIAFLLGFLVGGFYSVPQFQAIQKNGFLSRDTLIKHVPVITALVFGFIELFEFLISLLYDVFS